MSYVFFRKTHLFVFTCFKITSYTSIFSKLCFLKNYYFFPKYSYLKEKSTVPVSSLMFNQSFILFIENLEKIYQDIISNNKQDVSTKSENSTSNCNKNENNKINNTTIKRRSLHTQFKCYKCDYIVNSAKDLQDHFKVTHNSKAEYVCTECQALFDNLQEFENHYHEHTNVKRRKIHTCEFCGKQFNNATNYKAHRNLHLGECVFVISKIVAAITGYKVGG